MMTKFTLCNVLLEESYNCNKNEVGVKESAIYHLEIVDGKVHNIIPSRQDVPVASSAFDAGGALALPSFVEKHVHLDKTFFGSGWTACYPAGSIQERLAIEKEMLAVRANSTHIQAEALLRRILATGSTKIRTHLDIDQEIGLRNLETILPILQAYQEQICYEIVAFPQQGLLRSRSQTLIKEALHNGASLVGGVDPAGMDREIEASLCNLMELAVVEDVDIDLHLHDTGHLGAFTLARLAEISEEAGWRGRVSVSHAYCLGEIPYDEAKELAAHLAQAGIAVITNVPIHRPMPPVPMLLQEGVKVALGSDNIQDAWSPFGNGDILERAGRLAERFGWVDEYSLSKALATITDGITSLDKKGKRIWPRIGVPANFVLVEATCSAEAVATRAKRKAVFHAGRLVSGDLPSIKSNAWDAKYG